MTAFVGFIIALLAMLAMARLKAGRRISAKPILRLIRGGKR